MKFLIICFITFLTTAFSAQFSFDIKEGNFSFIKCKNHGFSIPIYESSINEIEKHWKKLMKQWHGKVDEKKHEFFANDVSLKTMGDKSFDTYAHCESNSVHIDFIVAVDLGGAFLNLNDHKEKTNAFKKELIDFAEEASKNGFDLKIKDAIDIETQFEKELIHLEKEQEKLDIDIESWKESIKKAENQILNNIKQQDAKKIEVSKQNQAIELLKLEKSKI
jgi:hypothetical protein